MTRWFYGLGWRGINVEPNPHVFSSYGHHRPDDINLNVGIARQQGRATFFQVHANALGQGCGLSSFDPAAEHRAKALGFEVSSLEVPVVSLQSIVDEYCSNVSVDFIKIDVEGFEASVLGSVDWTKFRPTVVCVEAVRPNSAVPSFPEWEDTLVSRGYLLGLFDGVNNYYVDHSRLDILSQFNAPVNCNDRFRKATAEDLPVHQLNWAGIGIQWGEGYYGLETGGSSTWRWSGPRSVTALTNNSPEPRVVEIRAAFITGHANPAKLRVSGLISEELQISSTASTWSNTLSVPPGVHQLIFECDAQPVDAPNDPRVLVFMTRDFRLSY